MELVTLKTFDTSAEAHLLKTRLENDGIPVFIFDENINTMLPMQHIKFGGVKLKIPESSIEPAREILEGIEKSHYTKENGEILKCPHCGSTEYYANIRRSSLSLTNLVSALFIGHTIFSKSVYLCKQCDREFNND